MKMKHNNFKNFICFLLAVVMIFSGMCVDTTKADSLLWYINHSEATSTLDSSDNFSGSPEFRTEDNGSRIIANSIKSENRSEEKTSSRTDLHLSYVEIFSQNFSFYFTTVANELPFEIHSNTVIINFIHQKDGKKA